MRTGYRQLLFLSEPSLDVSYPAPSATAAREATVIYQSLLVLKLKFAVMRVRQSKIKNNIGFTVIVTRRWNSARRTLALIKYQNQESISMFESVVRCH
jgi:hypothetical protein